MKRPISAYSLADGLLGAEQFQIAYATNDIERACELFTEQYGVKAFRSFGRHAAGRRRDSR